MTYRVGISGSYGGMNLGDEAILEVLLKELRASVDTEVVVFSRNPQDTESRHKVRAVPIRDLHKEDVLEQLKQLHLFVLGGGGDRKSTRLNSSHSQISYAVFCLKKKK